MTPRRPAQATTFALVAVLVCGCVAVEPPPSCPPGGPTCLPFVDVAEGAGLRHVTAADLVRPLLLANGTEWLPPLLAPHRATMGSPGGRAPAVAGGYDAAARSSNGMAGMGAGVAVADVNQDGCMDLFFADRPLSRLYLGDCHGHFRNATSLLGAAASGTATAGLFFDYDNDGFPDLFIARIEGPSVLLHNDGGHGFSDVSARAGVGRSTAAYGAVAADVDGDGVLDLLVVNYYHWWTAASPGLVRVTNTSDPEILYHNNGDGTFTDVTAASGLGGDGPTLAAGFADYDGDGKPDLALANDYGYPASLWHNDGGGHFRRVNAQAHVDSRRDGMGIVWADLHNQGWQDLYISNIFDHVGIGEPRSGNVLLVNDGNGTFHDESLASGAYNALWAWGGVAFDAESDGDLDLYVPTGYLDANLNPAPGEANWSYAGALEPQRFFLNVGPGIFSERAASWGLAARREGRAAAALDFNGDGAVDLVATAVDRTPLLLENRAPQGHFIDLLLRGTTSNRDAVGAQVWVTHDGRVLLQERQEGSGFESESSPVLHFGLGQALQADGVRVRWPSGLEQQFGLPPAGRYTLVEGEGLTPP
ncbi:MAG: CRTAC1 family protein [Thermoplasmatota archaeon]